MESFSIAPAATRMPLMIMAITVLACGGVFVLLAGTVYGSRTAQFEVSPEGLRLRGDWYGRHVPADQIRANDARRVDLAADSVLAPARRTFGTGLPGYQAGWFRLRNGERALLYLTDRTKAVYVPTTAGFSLLLSPADPDAFLASMRSKLAGG